MFADSLDISNKISSKTSRCFLGVSVVEVCSLTVTAQVL